VGVPEFKTPHELALRIMVAIKIEFDNFVHGGQDSPIIPKSRKLSKLFIALFSMIDVCLVFPVLGDECEDSGRGGRCTFLQGNVPAPGFSSTTDYCVRA